MVDRERILELLREQAFWQSEHVDKSTTPQSNKLIGMHYFLEGAFFSAGSAPAAQSVWAQMGGFLPGAHGSSADMSTMYITAYNVETGVITAIGYGADESDVVTVRRAVRDLLRKLPPATAPIRVIEFDRDGNAVVDGGALRGVAPGQRFTPETDGAMQTKQAENVILEVVSVDPLLSVLRFINGNRQDLSPSHPLKAVGDLQRNKTAPPGDNNNMH